MIQQVIITTENFKIINRIKKWLDKNSKEVIIVTGTKDKIELEVQK